MDIDLITRAVAAADLLALRTALYQATGDEALREYSVHYEAIRKGAQMALVIDERHHADLKERAVRFLAEEAADFTRVPPTEDEVRDLMELTLNASISDEDFDLRKVIPAFEDFPRDARWTAGKPAQADDFRVVIVGAGFSGIAMGVQLNRLGIPYVIYERRHELGGTWSINTYPDARVDTLSSTYEYCFVKNHPWSEYFARQGEVREYLQKVATEFGVLPHIRFNHDLVAAEFDEAASQWNVRVRNGDETIETSANVVVSASGLFATPKPLEIDGVEDFAGEIVHTTKWSTEHSAAGKSVAVIGNGSTGVQLLSRVASEADQVHVFQRTPQWIFPRERYGDPVEPEVRWLLDNMPYYWNWRRFTALLPGFDTYGLLIPDPEWQAKGGYFNERSDAIRKSLTDYIKVQVGGRQDLVDRLVPDYVPMARRPIVDNNWYKTLTKDHVELVTDPISHIESDAIVTADGVRRKIDLILAAVGFSVTKYLWPAEYRGRGGVRLEDIWDESGEGPMAYLGITVPRFPNLFILYGPNSQPTSGGTGLPAWMETWVAYVAQSIVMLIESGEDEIEVKESVFKEYNDELRDRAKGMIWSDPGSIKRNYYVNEYGRLQVGIPWTAQEYHQMLKAPRADDFTLSSASALVGQS